MKYVIILGDGMADEAIPELNNTTPLQHAKTPNLDKLAAKSELGMVHTIPAGMSPGSDTANLSVLGYNPKEYYTGRSPLEALSIGVDLSPTDIALRCNIVTLSAEEEYKNKTIIDHSSSEITTEEAAILIEAVRKELETDTYKYHIGTSYRHLLVWDNGVVDEGLTPPHDILGKVIQDYLPENEELYNMMEKSFDILNNHPINISRRERGLNPANSIWFWGAGTKPALMPFEEKYGLKGAMISAVDLLKGIAVGAKMKNIIVQGADGTLHTNYEGKAMAAVEVLRDGYDFVYVHIEAPDEMGHQGNLENKIKAIEYIDEKVVYTIVNELDKMNEEYRILVMPDHPTPIHLRTHTSKPVPYLLYDSSHKYDREWKYNEIDAANSGNVFTEGHELINYLFSKK